MNEQELQHLKMAWLRAEDSGDRGAQIALLRDYPDTQDELTDFIAAFHIIETAPAESEALSPRTERAAQSAMQRVFGSPLANADLRSLRARMGLSLTQAARGLRLGADVWKKFEDGIIDIFSLSERQLGRLAQFFHVSAEEFGTLLQNSSPVPTLNRRQTAQAARESEQQAARKQPFAEALEKSSMTKAEKKEWL
ncbi:MAG TPA: helix-turn-helix transcriptional regulator [Ktedonobacteraceae bacterium]